MLRAYGRKWEELGRLIWREVRRKGKFGIGNFGSMESERRSKESRVGEGHGARKKSTKSFV